MKDALDSQSSELVALYGRRRVGKAFLIRKIYGEHVVFEFTGFHRGEIEDQLTNFYKQLTTASKRFEKKKKPTDWIEAFDLLEKYLNGLRSKKKKVIFIDEFPWIDPPLQYKFLMVFEHSWNTYCTKRNDLVVVVCGSAALYAGRNRGVLQKQELHDEPILHHTTIHGNGRYPFLPRPRETGRECGPKHRPPMLRTKWGFKERIQ